MMTRGLRVTVTMSALLLASFLAVAAPLPAAAQEVHAFNVSAPDPASAMLAFGEQAGIQILASADDLKNKKFNPVSGDISTEKALNDLLAGTGLDHRYVGDRAVALVSNSSAGAVVTQPSDIQPLATGDKGSDRSKVLSDRLRVAQVDQGTASGPPLVEKEENKASKKKADQLQEIVVTGSRIPHSANEGPQEVKVYTKAQIEQSGQTTVADFLNTLPEVSVATTENGFQTVQGATTVKLHGLPTGTTLVLVNGRRTEVSAVTGGSGDFFDLNNIPLAAVERVEVVSEGASAVYGSDAIAGVVNIILRQDFDGLEVNLKNGWASDLVDTTANVAWGAHGGKGSLVVIGSFQHRSQLDANERGITAGGDFRGYGGVDTRTNACFPGNVFSLNGANLPGTSAPFAAVPAGFTGSPSRQEFAGTAGTLNACSIYGTSSLIPATERKGISILGTYHWSSSIDLFTELMYSDVHDVDIAGDNQLYGSPAFQTFSVSAANPFNPFGERVGVAYDFGDVSFKQNKTADTGFMRTLGGARGKTVGGWQWEIATWLAQDGMNQTLGGNYSPAAMQAALDSSNPATALNPFTAGAAGSAQLLGSLFSNQLIRWYGGTEAVNGFVRGSIFQLPSGPIEIVIGSEYNRSKLFSNLITPTAYNTANEQLTESRTSSAVFSEVRVPILANNRNPESGKTLEVTLAGRYDHYSDFGSRATPQLGIEWRPAETLLIRGAYSEAFKAPTLSDLYSPLVVYPGAVTVVDPKRDNQLETVAQSFGGNLQLSPETAQSRSFGIVYVSRTIPGLHVSVTNWSIDEDRSIQSLAPQVLVDNENLFPNNVIRAPGANGQLGLITLVNSTFVNFGEIRVAGFDYQIDYKYESGVGTWTPAASATQTYHYTTALTPGAPATDRASMANDDGNWSPRLKLTTALGWKMGPYTANVDGRYVGRYQDYDSSREIGNFWFCDANLHYAVGQAWMNGNALLAGTYLEFGAVNLFNKLPQYSNYFFGLLGYDPTQSDIRGRFVYVQLGAKL